MFWPIRRVSDLDRLCPKIYPQGIARAALPSNPHCQSAGPGRGADRTRRKCFGLYAGSAILIGFVQKYIRKELPVPRFRQTPIARALALGAEQIERGANVLAYTQGQRS